VIPTISRVLLSVLSSTTAELISKLLCLRLLRDLFLRGNMRLFDRIDA
jgi:hypothetical protein